MTKVEPRKVEHEQHGVRAQYGHALDRFVESEARQAQDDPCGPPHQDGVESRVDRMAAIECERMQDLCGVMNLVKLPQKPDAVLKIVREEKSNIRKDNNDD